jgi:hypothetical protein
MELVARAGCDFEAGLCLTSAGRNRFGKRGARMLLTRRCGFSAACYPVAPTPRREFDTVLTNGPQTLRAVCISLRGER